MTAEAYAFVVVCILVTLLAACVAAAIVQAIGQGRLGRWLRLDVRDDDR